jgi:hypothetical protein
VREPYAATVTVALIHGWIVLWYGQVQAVVIVCV